MNEYHAPKYFWAKLWLQQNNWGLKYDVAIALYNFQQARWKMEFGKWNIIETLRILQGPCGQMGPKGSVYGQLLEEHECSQGPQGLGNDMLKKHKERRSYNQPQEPCYKLIYLRFCHKA